MQPNLTLNIQVYGNVWQETLPPLPWEILLTLRHITDLSSILSPDSFGTSPQGCVWS